MTTAGAEHPPGLVSRVGTNALALLSVISGKLMIVCRLRRPPEGWRRTVGILLRAESTRFALSVFGLRVPAEIGDGQASPDFEERVAAALQRYLSSQPDAHFALGWDESVTVRHRIPAVDVVRLDFGPDGRLEGLSPSLAAPAGVDPASARTVHDAILRAYNETRRLPSVERPTALLRAAGFETAAGNPGRSGAADYGRRLLSACCLSFEATDVSDPRQRFQPPVFCARRDLGFGFLSVVMRPAADRGSVDAWISAHHVGLDGVPLQELVSGLEAAWGTAGPLTFPPPDEASPYMPARRCSAPGERPVDEVLTFVDFSPLFELRGRLNARLAASVGGSVTFGALLAWLMNHEPEFAGVRIASTVDVRASGGYERDVDVVPLRPADFVSGPGPWDGLVDFAREFNRLIAHSRTRTSPLRRQLQTAGLLPPWVHARAVYAAPAALDDTFGSMCITIIRDARVFVAPMTDLGLGHGFFAIGSTDLPGEGGRRVASVSIKGDAGTVSAHATVLRRLVARCASLPA
jgi:hypothetical protein